jgi:uncharacterized protein (TIGR00661 family)
MNILYAIQGTGNGHISRAQEIIPHLLNYGNVDLLVSGTQADVSLPYLIKYRKKGISYTFGKHGNIDLIESVKKLRPLNFAKDVFTLPVEKYNLVINDFEPISAWACKLKGKYCFGLSHQAAYLSHKTPRTDKRNAFAEWVFKNYAPVNDKIAFHFKNYDSFITTPVIRKKVRNQEVCNKGHITVYLPAYADDVLFPYFTKFNEVNWQVFSKHSKRNYTFKNVNVMPVNDDAFVTSIATGNGLITNGGFESPAEAIYLHKKVMAIPMQNQYEQQCNAHALKLLGATVLNQIDATFGLQLKNWLTYGFPLNCNYKNNTAQVIDQLFAQVAARGYVI